MGDVTRVVFSDLTKEQHMLLFLYILVPERVRSWYLLKK